MNYYNRMGKEKSIQIKLQEREANRRKKLTPAAGTIRSEKKQAENTAILNIAQIEYLDDQLGVHRLNHHHWFKV